MAKEAETPEWWNQGVVQEWISNFVDQKKYRRNFIFWVEWIGILPDEQLRLRKEQSKSDDKKTARFFEEKVKEYGKEVMRQGISAKTGMQYLIAVRSFFSHHYLNLKFRRGELKLEEMPDIKNSKKPKWVLDRTEFRALFNVCNLRDRPLVLILGSTGMSPVDAASLRIEAFRLYNRDRGGKILELTEKAVYGEKPRDKTNILQQFVLSSEVLFYLKPLLAEREYPENGSLLITRKGNPYTSRAVSERLQELATKAFGSERAKDFKTKNLRDFFQNGLLLANVNEKVIDSMMGWKKESAKQHYYISQEVILSAFEQAKEYYSVDGGRQTSDQVARLERKIGQLTVEQESRDAEVEELKAQLEEIQALSRSQAQTMLEMGRQYEDFRVMVNQYIKENPPKEPAP